MHERVAKEANEEKHAAMTINSMVTQWKASLAAQQSVIDGMEAQMRSIVDEKIKIFETQLSELRDKYLEDKQALQAACKVDIKSSIKGLRAQVAQLRAALNNNIEGIMCPLREVMSYNEKEEHQLDSLLSKERMKSLAAKKRSLDVASCPPSRKLDPSKKYTLVPLNPKDGFTVRGYWQNGSKFLTSRIAPVNMKEHPTYVSIASRNSKALPKILQVFKEINIKECLKNTAGVILKKVLCGVKDAGGDKHDLIEYGYGHVGFEVSGAVLESLCMKTNNQGWRRNFLLEYEPGKFERVDAFPETAVSVRNKRSKLYGRLSLM